MTVNPKPDPDAEAQRLAAEAIAAGDPTAWFERLYESAARGDVEVPWDRGSPSPLLVEWAEQHVIDGTGRSAMVVGCGLGDDAEYVASLGFVTRAFDVSDTAVTSARERFPGSRVDYSAQNLLELPDRWRHGFDFVLESLTVQSLPRSLRARAIRGVRELVAPGGTLLVISGALGNADRDDGPPWRLTRAELEQFGQNGLTASGIDQLPNANDPGSSRWRASFTRE